MCQRRTVSRGDFLTSISLLFQGENKKILWLQTKKTLSINISTFKIPSHSWRVNSILDAFEFLKRHYGIRKGGKIKENPTGKIDMS